MYPKNIGQSTDDAKLKTTQQTTPGLLGSSPSSTATLCVIEGKNSQRGYSNVEPNGIRPRKPCNCTKSQCLKL